MRLATNRGLPLDKVDLKHSKTSRLDEKKLLVFMMPHKSPDSECPDEESKSAIDEDFGSGQYK